MKIKIFRKEHNIDGLVASKGCGSWTDADGTIRVTDGQFSNGCLNVYRQKDNRWIAEWTVRYPKELDGIFLLKFDYYRSWNIKDSEKLIREELQDIYEGALELHYDDSEIILYHTDKYGSVVILDPVISMPGVYSVRTDGRDDCGIAIISEEDYEIISKRSVRLEFINAKIG